MVFKRRRWHLNLILGVVKVILVDDLVGVDLLLFHEFLHTLQQSSDLLALGDIDRFSLLLVGNGHIGAVLHTPTKL